jgi:hypothetical protein
MPTKAAFLDLKIENVLLKKKLGALKSQHKARESSMQSYQADPYMYNNGYGRIIQRRLRWL